MSAKILASGLGQYLTTPYSYLAMTKRSVYVDHHTHAGQEGKRLTVVPGMSKYMFVYPFLKTRDWFLLKKSARQGMMDEHIEVGHRFPSVKLNTSHSFGLDDQEWVVAFESDKPEDFLELVMALRETEGSRYTLRDTPIFTCIRKSLKETLDTLDDLVKAGKIRYAGVSNFSGWHIMKSLGVAERFNLPRYVANQTYYSLVGRDYEHELMPLGLDQGIGAIHIVGTKPADAVLERDYKPAVTTAPERPSVSLVLDRPSVAPAADKVFDDGGVGDLDGEVVHGLAGDLLDGGAAEVERDPPAGGL